MERRKFIKTATLAGVALGSAPWAAVRAAATATPQFTPDPALGWRTFEILTRVDLPAPAEAARVWVPLPSVREDEWIQPLGNLWETNAEAAHLVGDPRSGTTMVVANWVAGGRPYLEVASRFRVRDRAVDFRLRGQTAQPRLTAAERAWWTAPTEMLPTDGIVLDTARDVTRGARGDEAKARALYAFIVDHTARNPQTRGCGVGDIRGMLEAGNLSGKCADLNALYVGLARSLGIPARDVYGLRVADSRFGYKSLGKSGVVTKAQHCRAEVWLEAWGWVPVDPADVRKVILEEPPGNLDRRDAKVQVVEERLFGSWEMNWLAYNFGHDVMLPGSAGAALPFLMYPQGEIGGRRLDSLDPDGFRYTITSREIVA